MVQPRSFDLFRSAAFFGTKMRVRAKKSSSSSTGRSHSSSQDLQCNDDIFRFTRGRFVLNENFEMAQHNLEFNVNELARIAAETVGSRSCIRIRKFADGMYNRAMLLTMENGSEVVAKVPNPNAGRAFYTTASEVATMEFVRDVLKIPTPKVYTWSAHKEGNPVEAEYIIMEKVPGIELETVWDKLDIGERFQILQKVADYQQACSSTLFRGYGSLYYSKDLPGSPDKADALYEKEDGSAVVDERFAIGPSNAREFFDDGRGGVEGDRGPWKTLKDYHLAIHQIEDASIRSVSRLPFSPISLCGPGTYQPTRERKLKALSVYRSLMEYLLPLDHSIASSCLWHGDLHSANIFVNPSDPTDITGIIDWQATELAPLYFHARQPYFLDHEGSQSQGLAEPELPENYEELDSAAQQQAKRLFHDQSLCALWRTKVHVDNPRLWRALEFQKNPAYALLVLARQLLVDGEATYLARAAQLEQDWDTLQDVNARGQPCPIHFSEQDIAEIQADLDAALVARELMSDIKSTLGDLFPVKGVVKAELYDEAQNALEQMQEQVIEQYATNDKEAEEWKAVWPWGT